MEYIDLKNLNKYLGNLDYIPSKSGDPIHPIKVNKGPFSTSKAFSLLYDNIFPSPKAHKRLFEIVLTLQKDSMAGIFFPFRRLIIARKQETYCFPIDAPLPYDTQKEIDKCLFASDRIFVIECLSKDEWNIYYISEYENPKSHIDFSRSSDIDCMATAFLSALWDNHKTIIAERDGHTFMALKAVDECISNIFYDSVSVTNPVPFVGSPLDCLTW